MARKNPKKIPHLKDNRIAFSILGTIGVVAVWRGIWILFDSLPYFDRPIVAISLALGILVIAGIYFRKIDFF